MTPKTPRRPAAIRLDRQETAKSREPEMPPETAPPLQAGHRRAARTTSAARRPAALRDPATIEFTDLPDSDAPAQTPAHVPAPARRGIRWGSIFISALGALVSLGIGLYVTRIVEDLFSATPWLGWLGSGLLAITALAALALAGRETLSILRQRRIGRIRRHAVAAIRTDDEKQAGAAETALRHLYAERDDLKWPLARLAEHDGDILDPAARLELAERELLQPLDARARQLVARATKRVSLITALSPNALLDMAFVAAQNLRLLRELAALYGGRPGMLGLLRLARMVITHLALTGGIAMGDDFIHQLLGHGLLAKLSSRFGEGVLNGALTARIGLAAMDICRPLPFAAVKPPRLKDMLGELVKGTTTQT